MRVSGKARKEIYNDAAFACIIALSYDFHDYAIRELTSVISREDIIRMARAEKHEKVLEVLVYMGWIEKEGEAQS